MSVDPYFEKIFFSGEEYFRSLIQDIDNAKISIDLEVYIFELDHLGKKFIAHLSQAALRGVAVRVLVDGAGSPQWRGNEINNLEKAGAETRIFHPLPWSLLQWSRSHVRVPSLLKVIYLILKINSRNHRKTCTIDKKILYVSSCNISQNHLEIEHQGDGWRDAGVRLEQIDLADLQEAYDAAWLHLPIQERLRQIFRHIYTNPIIRLNHTRHRRRMLYKTLLQRIANCKKRIWITNAYFLPENRLLKKLNEAALLGLDVRILLPKKSDVAFMPIAARAFYKKLLKSGVRVFEYLPTMLHAKALILDDWMTIGSSNLNYRSLLHDLEIDINLRQDISKQALEKQFLSDLKNAKEIFFDEWWQKRRFYQNIIAKIILYFKYMI